MLEKLKQKLAQQTESVINFVKLPEEDRNARLEICRTCEHFSSMQFCKLCGCYMPAKTYMPGQSCPMRKWVAKQ